MQVFPSQLTPDLSWHDFRSTYEGVAIGYDFLDQNAINIEFKADVEARTSMNDIAYVVNSAGTGEECDKSVIHCRRTFLFERYLHSTRGFGRVAYRDLIQVIHKHRRKGISKCLLSREQDQLFRKWKAVEIQAQAALVGTQAWVDPHFEYELTADARENLLLLLEKYDPKVDADSITSITQFPKEFWEWARDRNISFSIYKTI